MPDLKEVQLTLLQEIDRFQPPNRSEPVGLLGTCWSTETYAEEIDKMQKCLVTPYWCTICAGSYQTGNVNDDPVEKRFAVVARDVGSGYVLCFDPERSNYALGWTSEKGKIFTFMNGDAVSTFMAR